MGKLIKMNYLNSIYRGKLTSCHTQALFNAYFKDSSYDEYLLFEALTTTSFGIKFIPNDSNRILDAFLDFDLGLDRALDLLDIDYKTLFFQKNKDSKKAISVLKQWLEKDVVLVGPLNMELLEYLYHPQLYLKLNHYLIALKYEHNRFFFLDSEGLSFISLDSNTFLKSWSGDKIIEGRGKFMMRQILHKKPIKLTTDILKKVLPLIIENIYLSQKEASYIILSKINIENYRYIKSSLSYAIANRLQRIFIQKNFFNKINILNDSNIQNILNSQINILNHIFNAIIEQKLFDMQKFALLHSLEDDLIIEIKKIISQLL